MSPANAKHWEVIAHCPTCDGEFQLVAQVVDFHGQWMTLCAIIRGINVGSAGEKYRIKALVEGTERGFV